MKTKSAFLVTSLLLLPILAVAKPKVDYKLADGDCETGSFSKSWWVVQRYEDGVLVDAWGMDCAGNEWYRHNPSIIVADDPTVDMEPTYTGVGDNGVPWYSVNQFNAEGELIWAGGRDSYGRYWVLGTSGTTGLQ
jgi:hypothetical protein